MVAAAQNTLDIHDTYLLISHIHTWSPVAETELFQNFFEHLHSFCLRLFICMLLLCPSHCRSLFLYLTLSVTGSVAVCLSVCLSLSRILSVSVYHCLSVSLGLCILHMVNLWHHWWLQVIVKQEICRKLGYAVQVEEEMLKVQLEHLQVELNHPTQFKVSLKPCCLS